MVTILVPYLASMTSPAALYLNSIIPPLSSVEVIFPKASKVCFLKRPLALVSVAVTVFLVYLVSTILPVKAVAFFGREYSSYSIVFHWFAESPS